MTERIGGTEEREPGSLVSTEINDRLTLIQTHSYHVCVSFTVSAQYSYAAVFDKIKQNNIKSLLCIINYYYYHYYDK